MTDATLFLVWQSDCLQSGSYWISHDKLHFILENLQV